MGRQVCRVPSVAPIHLPRAQRQTLVDQGGSLSWGRVFTALDRVNRLTAETRAGRQGRFADNRTRIDDVILDELGYRPFARTSAAGYRSL